MLGSFASMDVKHSSKVLSCYFLILVSLLLLSLCHAETINSNRILNDGEVVGSEDGSFQLGFFSPGSSKNRYLGIWFGLVQEQTVVWVANRDDPVEDSSGKFKIREDGNLVVLDGNGHAHWSTNSSFKSNQSFFELTNTGNLILREEVISTNGGILWQSFDYPSDTFLADMQFGINLKTGVKQILTSWRSSDDPSSSKFTLGFDPSGVAQIVIWNSGRKYWRSGIWNGQQFSGIPEMTSFHLYGFNIITEKDEGRIYSIYSNINKSSISRFVLSPLGKLERSYWNSNALGWDVAWSQPSSECQMYGKCGPNGNCYRNGNPICSCLKGFVPYSAEEWNSGNWSGGCVRRKALECREGGGFNDGFLELSNVKLPDEAQSVGVETIEACKSICMGNCSCVAFTYESGLGCLIWNGDFMDIQTFPTGGKNLYMRLAKSEIKGTHKWRLVFVLSVIGLVIISSMIYIVVICKRLSREKGLLENDKSQNSHFSDWGTPMNSNRHYLDAEGLEAGVNGGKDLSLPLFGLDLLRSSTNDFAFANRLGEGGFGPVYMGKLPSGQEIAVKRLSKGSGQGMLEFENEVILIAKLQHRNLVRLLGYCIQGDEKLLIYEYMPNKSLDAFLFDPKKRALLDWRKRFDIIEGIARGLLYLHRDSRLRIIHRDLKASNILLDKEMNPKISDFGMARIFGGKENQENTMRVVGTYGYMSPEYAMEGLFSIKSDIFSFGVILLEIMSGQRNANFRHPNKHINLVGYAWELWKEDKMLELLDNSLQDSYVKSEVCRCVQVGLLCVQDNAADRPTMDSVLVMLSSEAAVMAAPQKPVFSFARTPRETDICASSSGNCSANVVTLSMVLGR